MSPMAYTEIGGDQKELAAFPDRVSAVSVTVCLSSLLIILRFPLRESNGVLDHAL